MYHDNFVCIKVLRGYIDDNDYAKILERRETTINVTFNNILKDFGGKLIHHYYMPMLCCGLSFHGYVYIIITYSYIYVM